MKNTEALAQLAKKFTNPDKQLEVWKSISGFKQDVQLEVLKGLDPDLSNLEDLRDLAAEGALGMHVKPQLPVRLPHDPGAAEEASCGHARELRLDELTGARGLMASAAKRSFDKTLDRVIGLFSARSLHGIRGRPRQYVSDILRSSLVLAVAALAALVVDCVSGTFRQRCPRITQKPS